MYDAAKKGNSEHLSLIRVGQLFGELNSVTQHKWQHATVFALEECRVFVFSLLHISQIIKVAKVAHE